MAPPRKPSGPDKMHAVYMRLPSDVFSRVASKAATEGRPFNRIVINELAAFPHLERQSGLAEMIHDMKIVLARHSARLELSDLNADMLGAVGAVLVAPTDSQRQVAIDRLRIIHADALEIERKKAEMERDQIAAQLKLLNQQIEAIEALPKSTLDRENLPTLRAAKARLESAAMLERAAPSTPVAQGLRDPQTVPRRSAAKAEKARLEAAAAK